MFCGSKQEYLNHLRKKTSNNWTLGFLDLFRLDVFLFDPYLHDTHLTDPAERLIGIMVLPGHSSGRAQGRRAGSEADA